MPPLATLRELIQENAVHEPLYCEELGRTPREDRTEQSHVGLTEITVGSRVLIIEIIIFGITAIAAAKSVIHLIVGIAPNMISITQPTWFIDKIANVKYQRYFSSSPLVIRFVTSETGDWLCHHSICVKFGPTKYVRKV